MDGNSLPQGHLAFSKIFRAPRDAQDVPGVAPAN
ncbi:hypothetical protein BN439_0284 [Erwinia amylovora Ea644]|nr:hypothetical protein BN439_0284 [Erwinia amylovora Ea644]